MISDHTIRLKIYYELTSYCVMHEKQNISMETCSTWRIPSFKNFWNYYFSPNVSAPRSVRLRRRTFLSFWNGCLDLLPNSTQCAINRQTDIYSYRIIRQLFQRLWSGMNSRSAVRTSLEVVILAMPWKWKTMLDGYCFLALSGLLMNPIFMNVMFLHGNFYCGVIMNVAYYVN